MKWMRERDALIAQTMAFVQQVTGKRPELNPESKPNKPEPGRTNRAEASAVPKAAMAAAPAPSNDVMAPVIEVPPAPALRPTPLAAGMPSFQAEVAARIASFRKHQERFNREREAYFSATIARLKGNGHEPQPPQA